MFDAQRLSGSAFETSNLERVWNSGVLKWREIIAWISSEIGWLQQQQRSGSLGLARDKASQSIKELLLFQISLKRSWNNPCIDPHPPPPPPNFSKANHTSEAKRSLNFQTQKLQSWVTFGGAQCNVHNCKSLMSFARSISKFQCLSPPLCCFSLGSLEARNLALQIWPTFLASFLTINKSEEETIFLCLFVRSAGKKFWY